MDAKTVIKNYIGGKKWTWIVGLILFVVGIPTLMVGVGGILMPVGFIFLLIGLCTDVPANSNAKKTLAALESKGLLDKVAAEMTGPNKRVIGKNRAILTENFLVIKRTGHVVALNSVVWAYKYRLTQRVFLIPVNVQESLWIGDGVKAPCQLLSMGGKDKNDELKDVMVAMYNRNPRMLVGYSPENQRAYKAMRQQNKNRV